MTTNKLIILDNRYCKLETTDSTFLNILRKNFSFKPEGIEYSPAVQAGWDGITYLINKKNEFPLGLLDNFKLLALEYNIIYSIEDRRAENIPYVKMDISHNLDKLKMVPRDYQVRAVEEAMKNPRGIIRAATGSGKTLIAGLVAAQFNTPTIVYVIGLDLMSQFHKLFSQLFDEEIGMIGNGVCNPKRITIATIWTIGRALSIKPKNMVLDEDNTDEEYNENNTVKILKVLKDARVHLLDECHVSTCETLQTIYKNINPERLYGLSGTPYREDGSDLLVQAILGDKICDISASELIEKGVLAQPIIKFKKVPKIYVESNTYQGIYKEYIVENDYRNGLIISSTRDLVNKGYQTLVSFKQINHGKILHKLLQDQGIKCELLSGKDKLDKRLEVKEKLLNKEIDVLIASTIADIGLDIPTLSGLVLAGGGKSLIRCYQRIGRCIRSYPGKKYAAIVDFYDDIKYLKKHSTLRYQLYKEESGFKVIWI